MARLFGGIEAGGTKIVCALGEISGEPGSGGRAPDQLVAETRFPTTLPEETIGRAVAFFRDASGGRAIDAVGIASFGPIDPDPASATFGFVTSTPKPGWADVDLVGPVAKALGVPVGFDTDVNGAALAEASWGAARGLGTFVYLTIGTGIGGGAMVGGEPLHGLLHPEMGHMLIARRPDDEFPGTCPFHGGCLEGLAAGPAIEGRWGARPADLPEDHPAWDLEAHYLGLGVANLVCALSPQRVILGGGVMSQAHLFPLVRRKVRELLNGYVQVSDVTEVNDTYIVPPGLGNRSGVLGAIALAERASRKESDWCAIDPS